MYWQHSGKILESSRMSRKCSEMSWFSQGLSWTFLGTASDLCPGWKCSRLLPGHLPEIFRHSPYLVLHGLKKENPFSRGLLLALQNPYKAVHFPYISPYKAAKSCINPIKGLQCGCKNGARSQDVSRTVPGTFLDLFWKPSENSPRTDMFQKCPEHVQNVVPNVFWSVRCLITYCAVWNE